MSRLINWLINHPLYLGLVAIALIAFMFGGFNWYVSRKYDKARQQYETDSEAWATERAGLLGRVLERDKRIEQLEAKEAAIIAADQAGKKLDDALAAKIDEATKSAAEEAIVTDGPADCWVRAGRTCSKLAGLKPPIVINCDVYKRKVCSGQ